MCCFTVLADKVFSLCVDFAYRKTLKYVTYTFKYKNKMKELENEKQELEKKIENNKEKVDGAKTRGEIVKKEVDEWANTAENMKHEVQQFINVSTGKENMKCLKLSCPNLISRCRNSKKAEPWISNLKDKIQNGDFDSVSHPALHPTELQYTSTSGFVDFNSRKLLMKKITDSLVTPTVNMIGVYGAGGIGKTTTVEEVGKNVRKDGLLDEVVVAVVSQDVNVRKIQGQIAVRLNLELKSEENEEERRGQIWNRLNNGKNNLVILDDLWDELDLKAIGIPLREGNKGCKVILTTRNRDVLDGMRVIECIGVEVLSEDESWTLFERKVGVTFASVKLRSLAESVCKHCGGLPVAILAVGGALAGKEDECFWIEALDQMQNAAWENIYRIDRKMYASLKLSYDYLEKDKTTKEAKPILLLCCLYPEDDDIPVNFLLFHCIARRMIDPNKNTVDKARNRILTLIGCLKTRSLLLDGKDKDFVKMHDVVRDVGLSIANKEEQFMFKDVIDEWPHESMKEDLAAVSIRLNKLKEFPNELVCPRLHTLRIECSDSSFQFPDKFFGGVRDLKILELKGINILCSPSSLANLSKLGALILINCELEDMSFLKGLKSNLKVLVIEDCFIKALPSELGEVSGLRVLLLNGCYLIELIPAGVISKLTHLEELCLPSEFSFCEDVEISGATLSELSSLTRLTNLSVFIPDITRVPDLDFDKLVGYQIAVGEQFGYNEADGHRRKKLKLCSKTYDDKLDSLLGRAEWLYLDGVEGLKNVLSERGGGGGDWFSELESLEICNCHDWDGVHGNPNSSFSKLTQLTVAGCRRLKFVFTTSSIAKGFQQLQCLYIEECEMLEEIVGTEDDEKDEHDHLFFSKLTELRVVGCRRLKFVFTSSSIVKGLQQLQSLHIGCCEMLEEIVRSEDDEKHDDDHHLFFSKLRELSLRNMPKLRSFWGGKVEKKKAKGEIGGGGGVSLPQPLFNEKLRCCEMLEEIVRSEDDEKHDGMFFSKLRELSLRNMPKLRSFWGGKLEKKKKAKGAGTTTSEEEEEIGGGGGVSLPQPLFNEKVSFLSLEELEIEELSNITEIWDKQVLPTKSFPQLANVLVSDCEKLVNIFPSSLWIQSLEDVTIRRCKGVEVIVLCIGVEESNAANNYSIIFPRLQKVKLFEMQNLKTFCSNSNGSEPQFLFDSQVSFLALEELEIEELSNVAEIWDKQVLPTKSFPQLANVLVSYCDKLVNIFPSSLWAQSLENVTARRCKGVEVIVLSTRVEESEAANNYSIIFPRLQEVNLSELQNLKTFCSNSTGSEPQFLFDTQVQFPVLKKIFIDKVPHIDIFAQQLSKEEVKFPAIKELEIDDEEWYTDGVPNMEYLGQQLLE